MTQVAAPECDDDVPSEVAVLECDWRQLVHFADLLEIGSAEAKTSSAIFN